MNIYALKVADNLCKGFEKNIHERTYAFLTDYYLSIMQNEPPKSCTDSVVSLIVEKDLKLGTISQKMFECLFYLNIVAMRDSSKKMIYNCRMIIKEKIQKKNIQCYENIWKLQIR